MVPDSLLALFDENELELLICGVRDYKLSELVNLLGIREIGQYGIMIVNHFIKISCNILVLEGAPHHRWEWFVESNDILVLVCP